MTANIRRGLTFVAFGFLFTLVNINLTFPSGTVNVMPNFVGWILFFLAFDRLGSYVSDRPYLKWIALVLVILSAASWLLDIARPELGGDILHTIITVISTVYLFILFGPLQQIARDYGSTRAGTLNFLRYFNLAVGGILLLVELLGGLMSIESLVLAASIVGAAALVAAIITMVVLFLLRGDIPEETA